MPPQTAKVVEKATTGFLYMLGTDAYHQNGFPNKKAAVAYFKELEAKN